MRESREMLKAGVPASRVPFGDEMRMFCLKGKRTISVLSTIDVVLDEKVERPPPLGGCVNTPSIVPEN